MRTVVHPCYVWQIDLVTVDRYYRAIVEGEYAVVWSAIYALFYSVKTLPPINSLSIELFTIAESSSTVLKNLRKFSILTASLYSG